MSFKVGYLGPAATFTHLAVTKYFEDEAEQIPFLNIPKCIDAVAAGEIDVAVVPLENALEGSVNLTVDYLVHEQPLPIVGEIVAPIQQHLLVHPQREHCWEETEKVYSHSHAIAQCHKFLHRELPDAAYENATSTGAAAKYIQEHPEEKVAAIANELAAEEYGLKMVRKDIHDYPHNHTRFAVLHPDKAASFRTNLRKVTDRTTLMITLPSDQSGALHQVLSAFSWRKLNLSKIESRPMKTGLGNYFFIVDIDMQLDEVLIPGATAELEALGCGVRILGTYSAYAI
ncbi:prephenate dehydratase [Metabacillus sp. cB07]|uniref:prephenate dehydratase n=1 Tax=Metabacillus sp. cB07 TaxID=2806989 RepID=UPI001939B403|nr:prephenate dehydratase [Metabacillus sp. cB07]